MMKYRYKIKPLAQRKIRSFYYNVAKNEMSHIMGNDDLMTQTIKFVRSIRRKAKAEKVEWEYVPNEETRAAIEECESGKELETLDIANFKAYVKSL